jgi:hypothetical protein
MSPNSPGSSNITKHFENAWLFPSSSPPRNFLLLSLAALLSAPRVGLSFPMLFQACSANISAKFNMLAVSPVIITSSATPLACLWQMA